MFRVVKGLGLIGLFVGIGWSQNASINTVTPPPIFVNKITTGTVSIPNQYYIGQTNHLIRLVTSNQPAKVCPVYAAPNIILRFQGSWDNSAWFDVGAPITFTYTQPDGSFGALRVYTGAYPYLRLNLEQADTTNCQHTAFYSGTVTGSFYADNFKWQDLGYVVVGGNLVHNGVTALANGSTNLRFAVYAVSLASDGTNALNVTTFCEAPTCLNAYWIVGLLGTASNPPYILPFTGKAYFVTDFNTSLGLKITGGTGDNGHVQVVGRFE